MSIVYRFSKLKKSFESDQNRLELLCDASKVVFLEYERHNFPPNYQNFNFVRTPLTKMYASLPLTDDFQFLTTIYKGNFTEVKLVRESSSSKIYAAKIMNKQNLLSDSEVNFMQERQILAKNQSPWLLKMMYAFHDSVYAYLITEYVPGGDLVTLMCLYGEFVDEEVACFYVAEIVEAVHTLHKLGYAHRDLKPENILLDRTGHLKICDFGSATAISNKGICTVSGVNELSTSISPSSPDYVSPELIHNWKENSKIDYGVECDFWSIGVIWFEMLIGRTPFRKDSNHETCIAIKNIKNEYLVFPDYPEVSDEVKVVIEQLCCVQNERATYYSLTNNSYFAHIDFPNLRNERPPHIPQLDTDDSFQNYTEVESDYKPPSMNAMPISNLVDDLQFAGFTYIRPTPISNRKDSSISDSSFVISPNQGDSHPRRSSETSKTLNLTYQKQIIDLARINENQISQIASLNDRIKILEKEKNEALSSRDGLFNSLEQELKSEYQANLRMNERLFNNEAEMLNKQILELDNLNNSLKEKNVELRNAYEEEKRTASEAIKQQDDLQFKLVKLTDGHLSETTQLRLENDQLREEIMSLKLQLEVLNQKLDNEALQKTLNEKDSTDLIKEVQAENNALMEEQCRLVEFYEDLKIKASQLAEESIQLKSELCAKNAIIDELDKKIAVIATDIEAVYTEKQELDTRANEADIWKLEKEQLEAEISRLETLSVSKSNLIANLLSDNQTLKELNDAQLVSKLEEKVEDLNLKLSENKKHLDDIKDEARRKESANQFLQKSISDLKKSCETNTEHLLQYEQLNNSLKSQFVKEEQLRVAAEAAIAELTSEMEALHHEIHRKELKVYSLGHDLEKAQSHIATLNRDLDAKSIAMKKAISDFTSEMDSAEGVIEELKQRNTNLVEEITCINCEFNEERHQYEETIAQFRKLTDHLQESFASNRIQKKRERRFSHKPAKKSTGKENIPNSTSSFHLKNVDCDRPLYDSSNQSSDADTSSYKSLPLPSLKKSTKSVTALQRIQHNIPHRMKSMNVLKRSKCAVCMHAIAFYSKVSKCQECGLVCHEKCNNDLMASCGLSDDMHRAFNEVFTKEEYEVAVPDLSFSSKANYGSYIKILHEKIWKKFYAVCCENSLLIYESAEMRCNEKAMKTIELKQGRTFLTPEIESSELPFVAVTDLPFVLKVEIKADSSLSNSEVFFLMAETFENKQLWMSCLEQALQGEVSFHQSASDMTIKSRLIHKISKSENVTMAVLLQVSTNLYLFGSQSGLYILDTNSNMFQRVSAYSIFNLFISNGLIFIIAGPNNKLFYYEVDMLVNVLRLYSNDGITLSCFGDIYTDCLDLYLDENSHTAVLSTKFKLFYLQLIFTENSTPKLKVKRSISPNTPNQKVIWLSPDSVLVLNNRLSLWNLGSNCLTNNYYSVLGREKEPIINCFMVDASTILLCYRESGTLLNTDTHTAHTMYWSHPPADFGFVYPWLYISYYNSLEVINIQSKEQSIIVDCIQPKILGKCSTALLLSTSAHSCHLINAVFGIKVRRSLKSE